MKRTRTLVVAALVGVVALVGGIVLSPAAPRPSTERTGDAAVAARLAELADGGAHHELAVAVVTPDGTTFAGLGADETTTMEIGSVTKTMTSLLLARASAEGAVALDEPAATHLDLGAQTFTLEDLATHRSGLPRLEPGFGAFLRTSFASIRAADPYTNDVSELVAAGREAPVSDVGEVAYSNFGVALLGQAVAAAEGVAYEDLLARDVFEPLGMTASSAPVTADALPADAPHGYAASGRPADPWTLHAEAPAGGVRSTAADMARYATALLEADPALGIDPGAVLDPRHETDDGDAIGLAWFVEDRDGRTITWHNGGTGGYSTMLVLDREAGTAVYVAGDTTASVDDIAFALLDDSIGAER